MNLMGCGVVKVDLLILILPPILFDKHGNDFGLPGVQIGTLILVNTGLFLMVGSGCSIYDSIQGNTYDTFV